MIGLRLRRCLDLDRISGIWDVRLSEFVFLSRAHLFVIFIYVSLWRRGTTGWPFVRLLIDAIYAIYTYIYIHKFTLHALYIYVYKY